MAYGAKKIFPIDTKPGTAVGISIPFNAPSAFFPTYTTKEAIKNNLINFLLTNETERYLNNDFGGNLRPFIFEQITEGNLNLIESSLQSLIYRYFPMVNIISINVSQINADYNEIDISISYNIKDTGMNDIIQITLG
jgi:phage baseplate assembly protein W